MSPHILQGNWAGGSAYPLWCVAHWSLLYDSRGAGTRTTTAAHRSLVCRLCVSRSHSHLCRLHALWGLEQACHQAVRWFELALSATTHPTPCRHLVPVRRVCGSGLVPHPWLSWHPCRFHHLATLCILCPLSSAVACRHSPMQSRASFDQRAQKRTNKPRAAFVRDAACRSRRHCCRRACHIRSGTVHAPRPPLGSG